MEPHFWPQTATDWSQFALALLAFVTLVVLIVYTEETAKSRRAVELQLKQSLFEKRLAIYELVRTFLADLLDATDVIDFAVIQRFVLATEPAQFLFGPRVYEKVQQIRKLGVDYRLAQREFQHAQQTITGWRWGTVGNEEYERVLDKHQKYLAETTRCTEEVAAELETGLKAAFSEELTLYPSDTGGVLRRMKRKLDSWMEEQDERVRFKDR